MLGSQEQIIQDTFGPYNLDALEHFKEVDFVQFEGFLSSLNSVYTRIISEMEILLQTEFQKASNYEQLSSSFS